MKVSVCRDDNGLGCRSIYAVGDVDYPGTRYIRDWLRVSFGWQVWDYCIDCLADAGIHFGLHPEKKKTLMGAGRGFYCVNCTWRENLIG